MIKKMKFKNSDTEILKGIDPNVQAELDIDTDALDVEWVEQPGLLYKYGKRLADATAELMKAEQREKVIRSKLLLKESESEGRNTAQILEAKFRTNPLHVSVKEKIVFWSHKVNTLQNIVFAINQRKQALEELVRLLGMEYFATPSDPRNLKRELQKRRSETQDKIRRAMNK